MLINRRLILKGVASVGASSAFPLLSQVQESRAQESTQQNSTQQKPTSSLLINHHDLHSISPINRSRVEQEHHKITGDMPHRAHKVLWNVDHHTSSKSSSNSGEVEKTQVVIIGGGISGLSAAWHLRKQSPILLEQAPRFGGNAQGESWHDCPYSIGAAYLVKPEDQSPIHTLLKEIGALDQLRTTHLDALTLFKDQSLQTFDQRLKNVPLEQQQAWERLKVALIDYAQERNGRVFPEIPTDSQSHRILINQLDRISFKEHLYQLASGSLPQCIESYLEQYCWSAFGASMHEVSAASGINFLAGEFDELLVGPGGNAWIAERLLHSLSTHLPMNHLRTQSLVYSVEVVDEGVRISYLDANEKRRVIMAQRVIMSCPKFVVKRILKGIEPSRLSAIDQLSYRAYLVSNALIKGRLDDTFYELFLLNPASSREGNHLKIEQKSKQVGITDITYGNFAQTSPTHTVLSLYHPLPYDSGRTQVYQDLTLSSERTQLTQQLKDQILPALKLPANALEGLRLTRWGHPLPVAKPNLIASGVVDQLRAPFKNQIFFAQQDNWALPAIEVALFEGEAAARQVLSSW